jgi:O-antigen/teichoic acid export membrane protein
MRVQSPRADPIASLRSAHKGDRWRFTRAPLFGSFGASGAIQLANIATGVLLARLLGPHDRGEFAAVILWPSILAAVGSLGVPDATTFYTARAARPIAAIVGTALVLGATQSAVLVGMGFAILPVVIGHYGSHVVHLTEIFLLFIPLNVLTLVLAGGLSGAQRFGSFQIVRIATVAGNVIGLSALAAAGKLTIESGMVVCLFANLATALMAAGLYVRVSGSRLGFDHTLLRLLLSFGVRSHLGNVSSLLNQRLDQLLISVFLAPVRLGTYVVAVTLCSATTLVGTSVGLIAFPRIAGSDRPEQVKIATRFVALTVVASVTVTLPILIFTQPLLVFFFGHSFASVANVARVLLLAAVILSTNCVLGATLAGLGRPLEQGIGELVALAGTAASLAVLLPRLGLLGAAIASVIAYAMSMAWMVHRLRARLGPEIVGLKAFRGVSGEYRGADNGLHHVHRRLLPGRSLDWNSPRRAMAWRLALGLVPAALAVFLAFVGAATTLGWTAVAAAVCFGLMTAMAVASWQRVAVLLIAYLPFTGILSLLMYPNTFLGDVARDGLIVTPLYIGLMAAAKQPTRLPRSIVVPVALLGLLATLQLFNPSLPSPVVGLVGLRGWLFFIPLMVVGARLASDMDSAMRAMRVALIAGFPVLVIGLLEALALAEGQAALLYRLYGNSAAGAFTTGDSSLQGASVSLGNLHRVPSLFSYSAAYYCFCLAMLVPGYFLWRRGETRRARRLGLVGFVLAVICALTSGTREAFLTVPLAVAATLYLDGIRPNLRAIAASGIGWLAAVTLLHVPVRTLPSYLLSLSSTEGGDVLGYGFRVAHSVTWLGLGPGTDTNAARAVAGSGLFDAIGGRWQESYLVKSWIELGVPGLVLVVWMLVALVRAVTRGAAATGSGRTLIAASSGFLFAALATSIKGAILDQAPANAYFWLFAGLAVGARSWVVHAARSPAEDTQRQQFSSALPVGIGFASVRAERAQ